MDANKPVAADAWKVAEDPDVGLTVGSWTRLDEGLEIGLFESAEPHPVGDGRIRVVRVDPAKREVVVRSAYTGQASWRGADAWARAEDLAVVINASMFHADGRSVFALRTPGVEHPTVWRADAGSALLVDPKDGEGARARLGNLKCAGEGVDQASRYATVVQGWRLMGCGGGPLWSRNGEIWSHALIGADSSGRLLFIHARTPWNTRVFTEILQGLPLDVVSLQYAEGGPEASLVVRHGGLVRVWVGSYETGFTEHDRNRLAWNLPSIVGVR